MLIVKLTGGWRRAERASALALGRRPMMALDSTSTDLAANMYWAPHDAHKLTHWLAVSEPVICCSTGALELPYDGQFDAAVITARHGRSSPNRGSAALGMVLSWQLGHRSNVSMRISREDARNRSAVTTSATRGLITAECLHQDTWAQGVSTCCSRGTGPRANGHDTPGRDG